MSRTSHLPAVDGLRGLAIAGVLAYHLDYLWAGGGFLGVDLFFVISGYVITRLIRFELERTEGVDLRRFYLARALRLLPALITVVLVIAFLAPVLAPDAARSFISTVPFTLTGTSNWYFIAISNNYFLNQGRSLLQHTWSLSVEAQYYLLWPVILLALRKRSMKYVLWILLVTSAVALAITFGISTANAGTGALGSVLYFGTPTHLPSLLIGSALGLVWGPEYLSGPISRAVRRTLDGIGSVALIGIVALFLVPFADATPALSAAFPSIAVLSGILIAVLVHPRTRLKLLFTNPLMLWLGTRSYSLYLWHWPIFQLFRPGLEIGSASGAAIVRWSLLIAASEASYRFIEEPWRSRRAVRYLRSLQLELSQRRQRLVFATSVPAIGVLVTGLAFANIASAASLPEVSSHDAPRTVSLTAVKVKQPTVVNYWAVGDSVLIDAKDDLEQRLQMKQFDGEVGRQSTGVLDTLWNLGPLPTSDGVIINIGNNGYIGEETFDAILSLLSTQAQVVVVTPSVPRRWQDPNVDLIMRMAPAYPNVRVADWHNVAIGHPEYFLPDGVHLSIEGVAALSDCIVAATEATVPVS